jgi:hypothetical protein
MCENKFHFLVAWRPTLLRIRKKAGGRDNRGAFVAVAVVKMLYRGQATRNALLLLRFKDTDPGVFPVHDKDLTHLIHVDEGRQMEAPFSPP